MINRVKHTKVELEGKLLRVRRDSVELRSGNIQELEVLEHPGAVAIVPLDQKGRVWFVEQYRHAAGELLLEIPAGTLNSGEDPVKCAQRESREEIGMAPGELIPLGGGFMAPGYSTEFLHFFLARELKPSALEPDADEELEIRKISLDQVWGEVLAGKLRDIKTIAALALALAFLERESA